MTRNQESIRDIITNDKRKCERLSLDINVHYSLDKKDKISDSWYGPFEIDNICGDGLSLCIDTPIEKNTDLHIKICISDESNPVHCYGKVVWCKECSSSDAMSETTAIDTFAIGIQFDEVHDSDKKRFVEYISDQILEKYLDV